MRASEFLSETDAGKIGKRAAAASQGTHKIRDKKHGDRLYHLTRMMMATAMADGKSKKAVDMDSESWGAKYNISIPYTEEEHNMLYQAMATVPTDHKTVVKFSKSQEPSDTYKASPVTGFKGYAR